jgi:hypothetical protein
VFQMLSLPATETCDFVYLAIQHPIHIGSRLVQASGARDPMPCDGKAPSVRTPIALGGTKPEPGNAWEQAGVLTPPPAPP